MATTRFAEHDARIKAIPFYSVESMPINIFPHACSSSASAILNRLSLLIGLHRLSTRHGLRRKGLPNISFWRIACFLPIEGFHPCAYLACTAAECL